jgi:hypothetical protein
MNMADFEKGVVFESLGNAVRAFGDYLDGVGN